MLSTLEHQENDLTVGRSALFFSFLTLSVRKVHELAFRKLQGTYTYGAYLIAKKEGPGLSTA